jgi:hypothetical protein
MRYEKRWFFFKFKTLKSSFADAGLFCFDGDREDTDGQALQFDSSEAASNTPYLEVIYSAQAKMVCFLKDHLGSIRATVQDTTGAPVRGFDDYDPWGYILACRNMASSILRQRHGTNSRASG